MGVCLCEKVNTLLLSGTCCLPKLLQQSLGQLLWRLLPLSQLLLLLPSPPPGNACISPPYAPSCTLFWEQAETQVKLCFIVWCIHFTPPMLLGPVGVAIGIVAGV